MASRRMISLVFVLAITTNVHATTYSGNIEYPAGTGGNEATIAIDFDFGNSFLFTYTWDGDATGWDALNTIDIAGVLEVYATDYGEWGMFVNDFDYPGGAEFDYGAEFAGWAYYVGDNENWSLSGGGVSFRSLSNGDWDSWVWTNYDTSWNPVRGPGEQPIPEPTTIALLGLGGLALLGRGRKEGLGK